MRTILPGCLARAHNMLFLEPRLPRFGFKNLNIALQMSKINFHFWKGSPKKPRFSGLFMSGLWPLKFMELCSADNVSGIHGFSNRLLVQNKLRTTAIKYFWPCKKYTVLWKVPRHRAVQRSQYFAEKKACIFQRLIPRMRDVWET